MSHVTQAVNRPVGFVGIGRSYESMLMADILKKVQKVLVSPAGGIQAFFAEKDPIL